MSNEYTLTTPGAEQVWPLWHGQEIARGLHLLSLLNLPFTPRGDRFVEGVAIWASDSWWTIRQLGIADRVDESDLQEAFRLLRTLSTRWPAPKSLARALLQVMQVREQCTSGASE